MKGCAFGIHYTRCARGEFLKGEPFRSFALCGRHSGGALRPFPSREGPRPDGINHSSFYQSKSNVQLKSFRADRAACDVKRASYAPVLLYHPVRLDTMPNFGRNKTKSGR